MNLNDFLLFILITMQENLSGQFPWRALSRSGPLYPGISLYSNTYIQLYISKLMFYTVHTPGASVAKIMHPAVCSCVPPYIKVLLCVRKNMHTPVLKSFHPAAKMCTLGALCTLNFEHCYQHCVTAANKGSK